MSATNQHRRQRQAAAAASRPGNYVNPSEVSLPIEDDKAAVKETPSLDDEPASEEKKSSLGYIAAAVVAGLAALGGSGILS